METENTMEVIDVLTCVYLLSLVTMGIVTNVRPFYVNYWNPDEHNRTEIIELDSNTFVAGMVANQIVIMILGK